ncbi:glycosyltransferase [Flavobacterium seoulense]|uniref:Glycosyl transferase family 1 domain-containing protein n=1 Tax=Flavobacterium seoulense TaxID=1492738 RepID=A0A066WRE9_9FLAO|nr:glycosyltransferase [Flavobacterium seoulense]KDN56336.1 hypothetical protein FEM21_05350 [Flavobacterium seoulense]
MQNTIVNYHATFSKTSGISEAARANFSALKNKNFVLNQINYTEKKKQLLKQNIDITNNTTQKTINIYHININDIPCFLLNNDIVYSANIYNIAYWAWEFDKLPEEFIVLLRLFDEIWVPSNFCKNVFENYSLQPVIKIPHLIEATKIEDSNSKPKIALPGKFIFLSIFDSLSTPERKNTDGLIKCFLETFSSDSNAVLILKTVNLEKNKRLYKKLIDKTKGNKSIILINENYSKQELIQLIDYSHAYISLHRAEGFGLTMAEAMLRNKIVIGTGYSGNLEFMNDKNSFLIQYELMTKHNDSGFIKKGYQYAEPDIKNSKEVLKFVYDNYDNLEQMKLTAKETIENSFSKKNIGDLMRYRLTEINNLIQERDTLSIKNNELIIENIRLKNTIKKYEKNILIKLNNYLKNR